MLKTKKKPYWEMTTDELREATKEFDQEFVPTQPLTERDRDLLKRARAKAGRPKVGEGAQKVLVTIERRLLRDADKLAKSRKTSRSQLIADGLRSLLHPSASKATGVRAIEPKTRRVAKRAG